MREIASYIVRIYRRGTRGISGVVEDVQTGCVHSFHSARDLWQVLDASPPSIHSKEDSDEDPSVAIARRSRRRRGL